MNSPIKSSVFVQIIGRAENGNARMAYASWSNFQYSIVLYVPWVYFTSCVLYLFIFSFRNKHVHNIIFPFCTLVILLDGQISHCITTNNVNISRKHKQHKLSRITWMVKITERKLNYLCSIPSKYHIKLHVDAYENGGNCTSCNRIFTILSTCILPSIPITIKNCSGLLMSEARPKLLCSLFTFARMQYANDVFLSEW